MPCSAWVLDRCARYKRPDHRASNDVSARRRKSAVAAKARRKADSTPTVDDYFRAATKLADLMRRAFDQPGSVKQKELLTALKAFEKIDYKAM